MGLIADALVWKGNRLEARVLYSRAGVAQHILVRTDRSGILVDTGDGCLRDLLAAGIRLDSLGGLLYTHGHFDHVGGLHTLLGFLRMIGRTAPLPICAPDRCTEVFALAHTFRRCYPDHLPYPLVLRELHPHERFELAGLPIEAYPMAHAGSIDRGGILDPIPAFGYRITLEGETIAITGDTGLCDEVKDLVRGADLAIIEATFADDDRCEPEMLARVHLSESLARDLGTLAKSYLLIHRAERS
ncbi:MAG TPA: ribonuclease Z [candidate division Zixibacteria bacterium]|nr:ribonuclease Z [candidate division Zixibacteria bacterium]MDD4916927.1 ribonuclease Z [candidate division Zixibacteria bacterium]MDM7973074.1 ribonuclease Z [candidate division Zixibacteria bacterium]HOD66808.1 ribonuclease Z [candidate division Zixibacteria bacterium]HOZ08121.1 ribonuclease Z [candidate division Zixibacteria bacterium]